MSATSDNLLDLLEEKFAIEYLNNIFDKLKLKRSSAKGIDRIDREKFEQLEKNNPKIAMEITIKNK